MEGWGNFFFAEVGASAALAGLIFVGVSINLSRILSFPALTNRALQALILLLTVLLVSSLMLVPGQSLTLIGIEVLAITLVVWIVVTRLDRDARRKAEPQFRRVITYNIALNQITLLPYIIGGVVVLAQGAGGLYWLVPAMLFSFVKAMADAWVLLVEIHR